MKPRSTKRWLAGCLLLGACLTGQGQMTIPFTFSSLDVAIPDGDTVGVANTQPVSTGFTTIQSLRVNLKLEGTGSGAFNGDLYVSLSHESGLAVLLGRTGRRSDNLFGYGDNGFDVTFDDLAVNGDIHNYRLTLSGNHQTAISGPLTGLWAPDGRVPENPSNPSRFWTRLVSAFLEFVAGSERFLASIPCGLRNGRHEPAHPLGRGDHRSGTTRLGADRPRPVRLCGLAARMAKNDPHAASPRLIHQTWVRRPFSVKPVRKFISCLSDAHRAEP